MPIGGELQVYRFRIWLGETEDFSFDMTPWYGRSSRTANTITVTTTDPQIVVSNHAQSPDRKKVSWSITANRSGLYFTTLTGTTGNDADKHIVIFEYEVIDPKARRGILYG